MTDKLRVYRWRASNPEAYKALQKAACQSYYIRNRDRILAQQKAYRASLLKR